MKVRFLESQNSKPRTEAGLRRNVYDSEDYKEGINAFLEKRECIFKGK